jgi:hypothetical protein
MSDRDAALSALLQPTTRGKVGGPLISEVGADVPAVTAPVADAVAEGPTMLEMMMAAQAEAKKEKEKVVEVEKEKTTKSFGSGFKKGFFGGDSKPKAAADTKSAIPSSSSASVNKSSTATAREEMPTISKKSTDLVIDEVQSAMKDENPMLKQLKQGGE